MDIRLPLSLVDMNYLSSLRGLSITAADIQPERVLRLQGRRDHFLLSGDQTSRVFRSFLVPIPPTAKM